MSATRTITLAGVLLVGSILLVVSGCGPSGRSVSSSGATTTNLERLAQAETSGGETYNHPLLDAKAAADEGKSGAELWAVTCKRCHNIRSPSSLSDDQWEIVVNHMRMTAGLTADDARKIAAFLKTAN